MSIKTRRTQTYLFGYPITHSASPALHNTVFEALGLPHRYSLHDTKTIDDPASRIKELIHDPSFGGAAVTMPIKVSVIPLLDRLTPAATEIGSVNTIVVVPKTGGEEGETELLGENLDWVGIRNSIVNALPDVQRTAKLPFGEGRSGFIIGGGGTTRAAVYAMKEMGISPVYLINRDAGETADIIASFPKETGYDLRALTSVEQWGDDEASRCVVGVGAIPSFEPVTEGEKMVYAVAGKIFESRKGASFFLDMCYKPRHTILIGMAEKQDWVVIGGVEPLIEQALAQDQVWLFNSEASPYTDAEKAKGLNPVAVEKAKELVRTMGDIKEKK
ncbi:hypothetical protein MNV49_002303 [Pseudohyphozyma bogoriensis]|nr:hypothetical protein MNV49_002303 [Pseudohyphozyma bogoriensis]